MNINSTFVSHFIPPSLGVFGSTWHDGNIRYDRGDDFLFDIGLLAGILGKYSCQFLWNVGQELSDIGTDGKAERDVYCSLGKRKVLEIKSGV